MRVITNPHYYLPVADRFITLFLISHSGANWPTGLYWFEYFCTVFKLGIRLASHLEQWLKSQ